MKVLRGNDIIINWSIYTIINGLKTNVDFSNSTLSVFIIDSYGKRDAEYTIDENIISIHIGGEIQRLGQLTLDVYWQDNGSLVWSRAKKNNVVEFVDNPESVDLENIQPDVDIITIGTESDSFFGGTYVANFDNYYTKTEIDNMIITDYNELSNKPLLYNNETKTYTTDYNINFINGITIGNYIQGQSGAVITNTGEADFSRLFIKGKEVLPGGGEISQDIIKLLNCFAYDETNHALYLKTIQNLNTNQGDAKPLGFYSNSFVSAKGLFTGESGGGEGLDENLLWTILGDGENPNKQINISHLTDALSTYATIVYVDGIKDTIKADINNLTQRITDHVSNTEIHVTQELKDTINKIASWFAEDENGNIYTKDYSSSDGIVKHRGFYSNSFVSAKGLAEGNIGGGGLDETLLWQILGNTGNEQISKTHLSDALLGYATEEWVNNKNYATNDNLNIHVNNKDIHVTLEEKQLWNNIAKLANYFAEDTENNAIYVKDNKGFYSNSFISTKGMSSGGSSGGGLDETLLWQILGNNGTEQISKTHLTTVLSEYITITSADGKYATKTELSNYATIESLNQTNANVTAVTDKLNDFLEGSDTDTIINKWKELEAFLSGMSESDNLAEILATKADITWTQEQLDLKLDKSTFNDLFEKVQLSDGNYAIRAKYGFYSDNFVSAKGLSYNIGEGLIGDITINIGDESYESVNGVITLPPYPEITELSWNNITDKPTWIEDTKPSYSWSEITNKPTTFTPSSHTHTKSQITDFPTIWAWGNITGKPTTLSGYGITDGVNEVSVTGSGNAITSASISKHILTLTKGSTFLLSSEYTAEDILEKLKTVDGSSSGLDADTLDGTHKSGLLTAFSSSSSTNISITVGGITRSISDLYATTAEKLSTSAGSSVTPVYFSSGKPVSCSYSFGNSSGNAAINNGTLCTNLNADLLDGVQGYKYFQRGEYASASSWNSYMYNKAYYTIGTIPSDGPSGTYGYGTLLVFDSGGTTSSGGAITQIYFPHGEGYAPQYRTTYQRSSTRFHSWKSLARTTDNVASATKLQTARTIWGQSFDGTRNINGNISIDGVMYLTGQYAFFRYTGNTPGIYFGMNSDGSMGIYGHNNFSYVKSIAYIDYGTGNLGIGISPESAYKLHVNGTTYATSSVIGSSLNVKGTAKFNGETRIQSYIANSTTISLSTHPTFKLTSDSSYGLYGWITGSGDAHLQAGYENNSGFFDIILNELGGNVGIGTKSPSQKLHVSGNILATGAITAKSVSDIRLKTIIPTKVDYQQKLLDLGDVVDFYYNDAAINRNTGAVDRERHIGLIYQNAVKLNLVNFCHQDNDGFGSINYIAPDYINLIAGACQLNILGLRALTKRTESIEQRVARLEKENIELKQKLDAYEKSNSMVS